MVGNAFCIPVQNLMPPFFPWSEAWNAMMDRFVQTPFGSHFSSFEQFGLLGHGVSQINAGVGLGVCLMLLLSIATARRFRSKIITKSNRRLSIAWVLRLAPWALLLVFMAKVGTYSNARQLAAYYPFLLPIFLAGSGYPDVVRRIWWQRACLAVMSLTVAMLVVARDRPLFPAQTISAWVQCKNLQGNLVSRAMLSFRARFLIQEERNYLKVILPPGEKTVGFVAAIGHNEAAMWLPFGRRRVERLLVKDPPENSQPSAFATS